jgi:predicted nucleic acid-binding protein
VILVDSGPLVAAGSTNDPQDQTCTELLGSATEDLLVPATVSAEVC